MKNLHIKPVAWILSAMLCTTGVASLPALAVDETAPVVQTEKSESIKSLSGFQGIKWGDSVESASKRVSELKGFKLLSDKSDEDSLYFTGGELGGQSVSTLALLFSDEGFYGAVVYFEGKEQRAISQYNEMQDLLKRKYGEPSDVKRSFLKPYYDGDGYELQAIREGKGDVGALWFFPIEEEKNADDGNVITLQINNKLVVSIFYSNLPRSRRWEEKRKKKNSDDL